MPKFLKNLLQYTLLFLIGAGILWYVVKDYDLDKLLGDLLKADFSWIAFSMVIGFVAHYSRAVRWNLLLETTEHYPTGPKTFLAVMSGYFANLFAPRAGEVVRCLMLNRMERVPVTTGIGSVVAERVFDFICLLILIGLTFIVEFNKISSFLGSFFIEKFTAIGQKVAHSYVLLIILVLVFLGTFYTIWHFRAWLLSHAFTQKIFGFMKSLWEGVISIVKLQKRWQFIGHTVLIWTCYYLMAYVLFFALPGMAHLGIGVGLVVLVVGGLGMSAPVQGGIGVYHAFVASALVLYGIEKSDGLVFAFLAHTSQAVFTIIVGGTSFIAALLLTKK